MDTLGFVPLPSLIFPTPLVTFHYVFFLYPFVNFPYLSLPFLTFLTFPHLSLPFLTFTRPYWALFCICALSNKLTDITTYWTAFAAKNTTGILSTLLRFRLDMYNINNIALMVMNNDESKYPWYLSAKQTCRSLCCKIVRGHIETKGW